jgi:hypothetical protein
LHESADAESIVECRRGHNHRDDQGMPDRIAGTRPDSAAAANQG